MFERVSLAKDSIKHLNKLIKSSKDSLSSVYLVRFENSIKQAKISVLQLANRHVKGDWSFSFAGSFCRFERKTLTLI